MLTLSKLWYQKNLLSYLLTPFSGAYRLILALKNLSYRQGWKKITQFPVPVIVVGNITVGGVGKTPLIISLARFLSANGYKPGIVSRGYGGRATHFPQHVDGHSDPLLVGDEPVLIARKTGCPVVVDPDRVTAVTTLLTQYDCDIVLSDDGLQHTAMGRDIEIIVIDGVRRFGNGFCLPAGPLREPLTRLNTVDFLVTRGNPQPGEYAMTFVPGDIYRLTNPQQILTTIPTQPIHAVAGIGHPQIFFEQLRHLGFHVIEHAFKDHHIFRAKDIDFGRDALVVMTEKDAVKCQTFADDRHWCLPVLANCDSMSRLLLQKLAIVSKHNQTN